MNGIRKYNVPFIYICINQLNKRNIHIPQKAVKGTNFCIESDEKAVEVYSFYNKKNELIKRVKQVEDFYTREKTYQVRYYSYAPLNGKKRLTEVNQYTFGSDKKCTGGEHWHFYYPKFEKKVRYAKSGSDGKKDNFIKTNNFVVSNNHIEIKPISIAEYLERKRELGPKKFIGYPWTPKESITSDSACTDSIEECTAVGIIGKRGISLNHFSPANEENKEFCTIEKKLSDELDEQGKDPKVFMIGSCEADEGSNDQFNAIDEFFTKRNIPHSKYKTGNKVLYGTMQSLTNLNNYNIMAALGFHSHNKFHSKFYNTRGQHIIYQDGKLLITNPIIDRELINGNTSAQNLINKSFGYISD